MARRVRVLGAERGAERVDLRERQRTQFAFELARNGQVTRFAEEILRVVHMPFAVFGHVVQVERRHLEHGSGAFGITAGDQRGVQVVEPSVVEIFVDRVSHRVTDTQHGAEGVRARAQVGDLAQEFHRVPLFLQRIGVGIGAAVHFDITRLDFDPLARTLRLDERTRYADAGAGGDSFEQFVVEFVDVDDDLDIMDDRAVVQRDERYVFVAALGADPAFGRDLATCGRRLQQFCDFGSASL